jgi:hypothetical protein
VLAQAKDTAGQTPADIAAENRHPKAEAFLLAAAGADAAPGHGPAAAAGGRRRGGRRRVQRQEPRWEAREPALA